MKWNLACGLATEQAKIKNDLTLHAFVELLELNGDRHSNSDKPWMILYSLPGSGNIKNIIK